MIGDGIKENTRFGMDTWRGGRPIKDKFDHVFALDKFPNALLFYHNFENNLILSLRKAMSVGVEDT